MKHTLVKAAISISRVARIHRFLCPFYGGRGVILGMHRVVPASERPRIAANSRIEITPHFLEELIIFFRKQGHEILSLDEMHNRLIGQKGKLRPFVCFTFDDGYADIIENALPVFERHGAPFAVYVVTRFADRKAVLWWYMMEDLLLEHKSIDFRFRGGRYRFPCDTAEAKEEAFQRIKALLMEIPQDELPEAVEELCQPFGKNPQDYTSYLMGWEEVRMLSQHPLATVGAHTVHHYNLSQLPTEQDVEWEIMRSKEIIEKKTGQPTMHFAYPFGSRTEVGRREFEVARRCGFRTGVTVREGAIFPEHGSHTHCLPRIEITGRHQDITLVDIRRCGTISALRNGFRRVITE